MAQLEITLVKSLNGRLKKHQACVRGLGIRRLHRPVRVNDTPENQGMIRRVSYLLRVEDV